MVGLHEEMAVVCSVLIECDVLVMNETMAVKSRIMKADRWEIQTLARLRDFRR